MNCAVSKRTAPKIFCVFRSPRVGMCGWLATRAQVACRVGVWRNDASSSKTIIAPSLRAFFKARIGITNPSVLPIRVGLHKSGGRTLHRITQLLEQLADVSRMVMPIELIADDTANDWGSPNTGLQTISHRAAVQNIL